MRLDRSEQDFRDAKNHVYGLAHNVCVNGKEQNALLAAMQSTEMQMIKEGGTGEEIILSLLCILFDGLNYGNWPWIKNAVNTLDEPKSRSK